MVAPPMQAARIPPPAQDEDVRHDAPRPPPVPPPGAPAVSDTPPLWLSLELDPGTAAYFGLPSRLYLPAGPETPFQGDLEEGLSLEGLAHALEDAAARHPEMEARPEIHRFLRVWPRYVDLERYLRVGNPTFARQVAVNLLDEDPRDAPALAGMGVLAAREGDWEQALAMTRAARESAPSHAPTRLQFALALAGAGRRDEALEELDGLVDLPRVRAMARLWRHEVRATPAAELPARIARASEAFDALREQEGAGRAWAALRAAFPGNPEVLATEALRGGPAVDEAAREDLLRRALAADPGHTAALAGLATLLRRSGRAEEGLELLAAARGRAPRDPVLAAALGQTLEQLGRRDEALAAFRSVFGAVLARIPGPTLAAAGHGLVRLAGPGEAARTLAEVLEARPGDPLPHQLLARLDEAREGRDAAERRLREAIRACGPLPGLEYALGDLLRRSGRTVEAEGLFKVLAGRHPRSPWGHRGLGDLVVETEAPKAVEHYRAALEIDPWSPIPGHDYLRGVAALRGGDAGEAARWLERAVAGEPDNPRYWCDLGAARFYTGNLDRALGATRRALDLAPGHPGFLHNLAQYHRARFRRHPLTGWGSLWRAWRLDRAARRAARATGAEQWRKDLWPGPEAPEPDPRGAPPGG